MIVKLVLIMSLAASDSCLFSLARARRARRAAAACARETTQPDMSPSVLETRRRLQFVEPVLDPDQPVDESIRI